MATDEVMLIKVDPNANNNKFYRVTLNEDDSVSTVFGRVGDPGKPGASKGSGRDGFEKTIAAKEKKGYVRNEHVVLDGATESKTTSNKATLLEHARRDLAGGDGADALTASLVERLVKINAHDIALASGGKIKVHDDGQVRTPLGVLTLPGIEAGEKILDELEKDPKNPSLLASYMSIVPQDVGRGRDWTENFFNARRTILQQRQFLEQLRDSVLLATQSTPLSDERAFVYSLKAVEEISEAFASARKMFEATKNETHHRAASQFKVSKVYEVTNPERDSAFSDLVKDEPFASNTRRMWHGTRAVNMLSILSIGLQHPSKSVGRKAGAMFGRGLYFSEQSTKSLNYSRGMWQGTHDDTVMMFICDVAMGWEFRPNLHAHLIPGPLGFGSNTYDEVLAGKYTDDARHEGKTFTSINVKAGTSGVLNHEAIVPGPEQVALRYLVEFNV